MTRHKTQLAEIARKEDAEELQQGLETLNALDQSRYSDEEARGHKAIRRQIEKRLRELKKARNQSPSGFLLSIHPALPLTAMFFTGMVSTIVIFRIIDMVYY